jgi:hypothetical protein
VDVPKLAEDLALSRGTVGEFRPLHFRNVRAVRKSGAVSGWENNPMILVDGQGMYFEDYVVWPAAGAVEELEGVLKQSAG